MGLTPVAPDPDGLLFRLLGPVEIATAGGPVTLPRRRERCLLAVLLLELNRVVSTDRLVELLWEGEPSDRSRRTVQGHVSRLRGVLRTVSSCQRRVVLSSVGDGYRLAADPDLVDAHRFRALLDRAADAEPADRVRLLRDALSLWRGPAIQDASDRLRRQVSGELEERRLAAVETLIADSIALHRQAEVLPELAELSERHPGRERLVALHMEALHRAGRTREALALYQRTRAYLAGELGIDPGAVLREAHRGILRNSAPAFGPGDTSPGPDAAPGEVAAAGHAVAKDPAPGACGGTPAGVVPAQLPPTQGPFVGREAELARLDALLPDGVGGKSAMAIAVIEGPAAVGKTALALRWAHLVRARFPGGQLYANLRGFAPSAPVSPFEVLTRFLRALGTSPERLPQDEEEAAGRYRSLLADRPTLIVLDDVADAEQVRPLLPAGAGSLVLVTSRNQLPGLAAREGATRLRVGVLPSGDAVALLRRLLDTDGQALDPVALAEVATLCGYLPLALRIAAANLTSPAPLPQQLTDYLSRLRADDRLSALQVAGGAPEAVSAAFDLSYARLPEPARRLFRLLALVPGPEATPEAAAWLAGVTLAQAAGSLAVLAGAHLVEEPSPGRFTMHDLLRTYAAQRVSVEESTTQRKAACDRLYDFYVAGSDAAARTAYPQVVRLPPGGSSGPGNGDSVPVFADPMTALAWLDAERANLVAAARYAAEQGWHEQACGIVDNMRWYFWQRAGTADWASAVTAALAAAAASGNACGEAAAYLSLASMCWRQERHREALAHGSKALELARAGGWVAGEAAALGNLAAVHAGRGEVRVGVDYARKAMDRAALAGWRHGEATALNHLSALHLEIGDPVRAVAYAARSLPISLELGSRNSEALTRTYLGTSRLLAGLIAEARVQLTGAQAQFEEIGNVRGWCYAGQKLAMVHCVTGNYHEAAELAAQTVMGAATGGHHPLEAGALLVRGYARHRLGQHQLALQDRQRALALSANPADGYHNGRIEALLGIAHSQLELGDHTLARELANKALAAAGRGGYRILRAQALTLLAGAVLAGEDPVRAAELAEEALLGHSRCRHRLGEAQTRLVLGHARARAGSRDAARAHWRHARNLFAELGAPEAAEAAALLDNWFPAGDDPRPGRGARR